MLHEKTFKMVDVKKLFDDALETVTADTWHKCIQHVYKEEMRFWNLDIRVKVVTEPFIIELQKESDNSFSKESSESDSDAS